MRRTRMNSQVNTCLIVVLFLASTILAQSSQPKRKASAEDTAGIKTELTGVRYEAAAKNIRSYGWNRIVVLTDPLQFLIKLDDVKSINKIANDSWEVTYVWAGQEKRISGRLAAGEFTGESDFGQVKISATKLKSLIFGDPPIALSEQEKASLVKDLLRDRARVVLANGTDMAAASLRRNFSYYSTAGYIIGGEMVHSESSDFSFNRGESLLTLDFGKLKSLEFGGNSTVTVTLANGNSASGTMASGRNGITGFSGISDKGWFFVEREFVKRITFEPTTSPQE
jgi:hypothetical protein